MKLLTTSESIIKAIDSIERRGVKLDNDIQIAALSVMQHHADHGDVTLINRLVEAMPNGSRVNALRFFIETYGRVHYDEEAKVFVHAKNREARIEAAMEVHWTTFKAEKPYVPLTDANAALQKLIDRFEKDRLKAGEDSVVPEALLAELKSFKAQAVANNILH